jgi:hypothetical protein
MEVITRPKPKPNVEPKRSKEQRNNYWFLFFIILLMLYCAQNFDDFTIKNDDGTYEISQQRQEELQKRKEKIDKAEQYALVAVSNGLYPCFNCGEQQHIFLYIGEVWKYGVSKNGNQRYKKHWYKSMRLEYLTQFTGIYSECLKRELDQIYQYPILPENLKREEKLPRPPGNKEDY